ncbi:ATP-binding protein [Archangium sp.]|uniref:ATP-binding protein n=1 Tax=Archangium sp. TaxID=1872627 RepID=UPI00389B239C
MAMKTFDIEPHVAGEVRIGSARSENVVWAGRMSERGNKERIIFDGSENFVALEVGKRGSGKSFGMGSILEAFATHNGSLIGTHTVPRAVLLLDPLDIHWTAIEPLRKDGSEGMRKQYELLSGWKELSPEPLNIQVFMPAGYSWEIDHPGFVPYQLPVSALDASDWAFLLDCDLLTEPRGRLIDEVYRKVTELGWQRGHGPVQPKSQYTIQDFVDCAEHDEDISSFYHRETIRSVVQPLRSFERMPLFDSKGTPLTALLREGTLSILCLGRLPSSIRTVLTTVIVRKLRSDRMYASQIRRRLTISQDTPDKRVELERALAQCAPRTILAIDEAQILLPQRESSSIRKELDAFVLEGRNYGLSLWMATQRPKGAVSSAAASQIDTFIVHRLSVQEDIDAVVGLLQNAVPAKIRHNGRPIELSEMIRQLEAGQAIFSSAVSTAPRLVVGTIRPRVVAHGGEGF